MLTVLIMVKSNIKEHWYTIQNKTTSNLTKVLLTFLAIAVVPSQLNAQQYTYTVESFEESAWPTTEPDRSIEVTVSTGTWEIRRGLPSSSVNPPAGSKGYFFQSSGYVRSPELSVGASTITFQGKTIEGRGRSIVIATSINGTDFTDVATPALSELNWESVSVDIKDANVKYIRFSSRAVAFDNVLITPFHYKITPEALLGLNYVQNTGPGASESIVFSAVDLTAGAPIVITVSKNFEISVNGIDWGSTVTIPNSAGGTLPPTTIYTRLVAGLTIGDYSGTISFSGGGKPVHSTGALSGSVTSPSAPACISGELLVNIRKDDFGTFPTESSRSSSPYLKDSWPYIPSARVVNGQYTVIPNAYYANPAYNVNEGDHTVDAPGEIGGMLYVDCGLTKDSIIYSRVWPICSGVDLKFSAWYADANRHSGGSFASTPNITFTIFGGNTAASCDHLLATETSLPIPTINDQTSLKWHNLTTNLNSGVYSFIKLDITNNVNETAGNDLLIDDIEFPTAPLPIEICATDASCNGACDGVIDISRVSGNSTFTFVLDGKTTETGSSATFTNVCAGPHTLKITDLSGGCDVVPDVFVNEPDELVATAVSIGSCGTSGTVGMLVTGGTPGYQYREGTGAWGRNSIFTGLSNGSHTIEVKDAKGCITSATATVSRSAATLTLTSAPGTDAQTVRINSPVTDITYAVGASATGATVTGLPTGLSFLYTAGVFTISGTATQSGAFTYTVTTTGTDPVCSVSKTGTITINLLAVADVLDENGNGFIDKINFTIEDQGSTALSDKLPSVSQYIKTLKITNHYGNEITLKPQKIERVNDKTFTVILTENSGTEFETGWKSADFSTNNVSLVNSGAFITSITVVDKAGPVIARVLYEYGAEGKNEDVLKITFSEPVVLKNSAISPPSEVFNYFQREKLSTKAFESIEVPSFKFEADMSKATVVMTTGFFILPLYDSLQLKQVPNHLVDKSGNSAHEKSRVAVIEGKARITITIQPVVNPYVQGTALPEKYTEYYSKVLKDNNKYVTLIAIKSTLPLGQTDNGFFGIVSIYDCVGNLIQQDIPIYQANSPIDYGFTWNAKNQNQRNVNQGVYLAIVKVMDILNTQHVFKVKIGIK